MEWFILLFFFFNIFPAKNKTMVKISLYLLMF